MSKAIWYITWSVVMAAAKIAATPLYPYVVSLGKGTPANPIVLYGVPRGGIVPALLLYHILWGSWHVELTENPSLADIIVDDLIDSGLTRSQWQELVPAAKFVALFDKLANPDDRWYSFPWERMSDEPAGVEDNVLRLIQFIGDDPKRDGLLDTPARVVKSFAEIYGGYHMRMEDILTVFDQACDEMVILRDIEFYSTCEHHMLPFYGKAHIAYIPDGKVIGISKLARVLEMYSRRLQNQERICSQVTEALMEHLKPLGAACVLEGQHFCMQCRGVGKQNSVMITSSLLGKFREDPTVRTEFMSLIKG